MLRLHYLQEAIIAGRLAHGGFCQRRTWRAAGEDDGQREQRQVQSMVQAAQRAYQPGVRSKRR